MSAAPVRRSERLSVKSHKGTFSAVAPTVTVPLSRSDMRMETDVETDDDIEDSTAIGNKFHRKSPVRYTNIEIQGWSMEQGSVSCFKIIPNRTSMLKHFQWCSNCRNGGTLNVCQNCHDRAFCIECMDITSSESPTQDFICPTCHDYSKQKGEPYVSLSNLY